jgi:hypothetical protein
MKHKVNIWVDKKLANCLRLTEDEINTIHANPSELIKRYTKKGRGRFQAVLRNNSGIVTDMYLVYPPENSKQIGFRIPKEVPVKKQKILICPKTRPIQLV